MPTRSTAPQASSPASPTQPSWTRVATRQPDRVDRQREQAAEGELPQAGQRVEVGQRLVRRGQHHRERERGGEHPERRDGQVRAHPGGVTPRRERDQGHQQRPDQEELPLDRQRPEVLHRARHVAARRVVDRVRRELPVLQEQRGRDDLAQRLRPAPLGQQQHPGHDGRHQHDDGARQQPHERAAPPPAQRQRPAVGRADELAGQQEARDDEEHVDAAGHPAEPHVVDDDERDGDRAQALQLGPVHAHQRPRRRYPPPRAAPSRSARPLRTAHPRRDDLIRTALGLGGRGHARRPARRVRHPV